ncbi:uncharacterized protein [Epargyreus clarus]|uniref:uncharacterized protein isoform X2 n=1 Tax=Epargyreus clarus TaxID=520877 RepID=UPI003C2DCF28
MEKVNINGLSFTKKTNTKIEAVKTAIHQTIYNFKDLITEIEQIHLESESFKKQINVQNEKCESKCCSGSEELKKVIESKNSLLELIASTLSKLNETQNLSLLAELFKIVFGDSKSFNNNIANIQDMNTKKDVEEMSLSSNEELIDNASIHEQDDSISEIAGTPTGRHSPIIQTKILKSSTPNNTTSKEKKKCPENWSTPERKSYKLTYPTPTRGKGSGRLKQQRLCLTKVKPTNVVDLTTSPKFTGGRRTQEECLVTIKQEVIENDDTIFPSPTSGPVFPILFKSLTEKSPPKFKKPLSLIRGKLEKAKETELIENIKPDVDATNFSHLEESVDLLKGYNNGLISPKKCKSEKKSPVQANESMSLLQQVNNMGAINDKQCYSPSKRPLAENVNISNTPCDSDSSMSILRRDINNIKMEPKDEKPKRSKSEIIGPVYKEPTVRKKADKRALPGWSCDECKQFYSEIYKDKPEMLLKMMNECSKHRGKNNPIRPKTPPGFWNPRWDVPEGTEEFNRQNNAI